MTKELRVAINSGFEETNNLGTVCESVAQAAVSKRLVAFLV